MAKAKERSEVPLTYLVCRAFQHELRFVTDRATTGTRRRVVEFVRVRECTVCGTRVETTYTLPEFRVKRRRYFYPDRYQVEGGYPVVEARVDYLNTVYAGAS